jgi:integrase
MKGSIQKKGNIYYAVIPITGKRKWFRGGTKKDAEKILAEKVVDVSQGTYRALPKITFQDFSKLWLGSYAKDNVKPSTLSGYNYTIEKRLIPAFEHHQMNDISTRAIQIYVTDRRKDVCGKSILNEVVLLKTMFKHAYRWGYIKINPCEHIERPKTVKPEVDILEPAEISLLLDKSSGLYRMAFLTALLTGVRAGELWALQWGDLDWNSMKLYVRRSVWRNQFQTPKSKSAIRKIDLPDTLIPELRKWKLACPISENDLMFPSQEGQITCHDNAIKRHFNPALRKANLRHVSFHSLRHTNASIRIHAGQNIKYMSSQLGHASVKITLDTYGHLFNDQDFNRRQVDMLETTFNASVRNPLEKPLQNAKKELAVSANSL